MSMETAGATVRRTTFRVTGLSRIAPDTAEFSEVLTYTGEADAHGAPIYSNAAMTASIQQTASGYSALITTWPGHAWQEVERVMVTVTPMD